MKEKLSTALGAFGSVLWYILSIVYAFAPLYILHFPFWVDAIIIAAILFIPFIGELVRLVLYVWAFIVVLSQPIDIVSIIFFVCAALYFFTTILPLLLSLLAKEKE